MSESERAALAQLDQDYQAHCETCFLGMLEHCAGETAPNGQPCATTPAERIAYLLAVVQQVVEQRDVAQRRADATEDALARAEAERAALKAALQAYMTATWAHDEDDDEHRSDDCCMTFWQQRLQGEAALAPPDAPAAP